MNTINTPLYKSFCFPYNGDFETAVECVEKYKDFLFELYGTDDQFKSSRNQSFSRPSKFIELVKLLSDNNIEFNYLLNSFVLDNYAINKEKLLDHARFLKDCGVTSVTLSSPFLINDLKKIGLKVSTSIIQRINNECSVKYHEYLEYDRIILDEDEIRCLPNIRHLRKITNLPIEIIINSGCLKYCPFRLTHWNVDGISHPQFTDSMRNELHMYCKQCKSLWYKQPVSFLKSLWVRPEELGKYKMDGVNLFKIGGRSKPGKSNISVLDIYSKGEWDGSVFDYLKPGIDPAMTFGISHIPNKKLDHFFDFFFTDPIGCNHQCHNCKHCYQWQHLVTPIYKTINE